MPQKAAKIKLLVLDIDGVLTDGRVVYDSDGREIKYFDVKDGHGLKMLMRSGVEIALLSGRESKVNRDRAEELGIEDLTEKTHVKLPAFLEIMKRKGVTPEQTAYMGDDLIDLPPMRAAGLTFAPKNAVVEVRQQVDMVSDFEGGKGAVRQVCEFLLRSAGTWDEMIKRYF
ncbi:HAD family hydrolase [Dethiosulfatarculus sandiegensis]|uniref:HAD family hydrolase n=1 Tax=Dethiosulfatarculus sandiegensis TaxID=1429043 RepID=A0A0D2GEE5_9BACT|nr:HAD family hydrolase [Dethiosulfatarculus sandiegensis]